MASLALDPRTNAEAAAARAAQRAQDTPTLEPPFPYVRATFDPFFFGLDREVQPKGAVPALT